MTLCRLIADCWPNDVVHVSAFWRASALASPSRRCGREGGREVNSSVRRLPSVRLEALAARLTRLTSDRADAGPHGEEEHANSN